MLEFLQGPQGHSFPSPYIDDDNNEEEDKEDEEEVSEDNINISDYKKFSLLGL